MNGNTEAEYAASTLIMMSLHNICKPRSARICVPRSNLGRRHFLNKNSNFNSYAKFLRLTEEQGAPLFSHLDLNTPKKLIFTDLYDNAEMEMTVLFLAGTRRNYIIGPGWKAFVDKHDGKHNLGVIRFYKEFDIWGGDKKYLIRFVKLRSVPRIEAKNDNNPPAERLHTDSGRKQRNIISCLRGVKR